MPVCLILIQATGRQRRTMRFATTTCGVELHRGLVQTFVLRCVLGYIVCELLELRLVYCLPRRLETRQGTLIVEKKNSIKIQGVLILSSKIDENIFWEEINTVITSGTSNDKLKKVMLNTFEQSTCPKGNNNRRKKRGLVDAGGEVLKYMFGTATTRDVNQIAGNLETKIKVFTHQIENLHQMSNSFHTGMALIKDYMVEQKKNKWEFIRHSVVQNIRTLCQKYQFMKIELEMGKFNPDLFNMTKLENIIEKFEFQWDLRLPQKLHSKEFNKLIDTRIINYDGFSSVLLTIPLVKNLRQRVFRLFSLPMITKNWDKHKFSAIIEN